MLSRCSREELNTLVWISFGLTPDDRPPSQHGCSQL